MDRIPPLVAATSDFKERRGGLAFFGVVLMLVGGALLLGAISILFKSVAADVVPAGTRFPLSTALMPSLLGGIALALGFGSIKGRRWARAIILCVSAIALCAGVAAVPFIFTMIDSVESMLQQQGQPVPPAALHIMQATMLGVSIVLYVVFPGVLFWFYRREDVRLTCNRLDPVERWTDRCPLPVLALVLLQAYGAVATVAMLPQFGAAFPLFGKIITAAPAYLLWVCVSAFSTALAWGCYRLKYRAWLANMVGITCLGISSAWTFAQNDLLDFYRAAGMGAAELEVLASNPLLRSGLMIWCTIGSAGLMLVYLLLIRRYFVSQRIVS
ncbi:MAG: hypothetical protein C0518_04485 [Opitutus sp.]|nr:hypothetical protein [Opitutus sp.]